jgi:hypothetical protein
MSARQSFFSLLVTGVGLGAVLAMVLPAARADSQAGGLPELREQVRQLQAAVVGLQAQVDALAAAGIQLWAQADNSPRRRVGLAASPPVEINNVSIVTPSDGFLVISGGVAMTNDMASAQFYKLNAKMDGADLYESGGEAVVQLDASGTSSASDTLAYTVVVPVTAGDHTVSQMLGTVLDGAGSFSYSRNNLTVVFVPASRGTVTAAP